MPFSCANAASALGHPGAAVNLCTEMDVLPGVFLVMLQTDDGYVSQTVVTDEQGEPIPSGTPGAAAAFLARHRVADRPDLQAKPVVFAMQALGALPPGWSAEHLGGPSPEGVAPGLSHDPLQLTLVRSVSPGRGPAGGVAPPRFERAVLRDLHGPWHLERHDMGDWVAVSTWTLP
jgi:hypothetical protein